MDNTLEHFMKEPEREFHIRELAKLTKKSPTTISKYLNLYKKEQLLTYKNKFNHLLYKANIENKAFKDAKLFYNIKKLRSSGLIEYLGEEFNHPEAITLFGSFRKAEDIASSDIDILIITPIKKEVNLSRFEKYLGHNIQLFLHSSKEIEEMKVKNKELLNSFINGLVLHGFWEVFK